MQEAQHASCTALRNVFVSGEALPPTTVSKFQEVLPHAQLHNLYGPTEATVDVTGAALLCRLADTYPAVGIPVHVECLPTAGFLSSAATDLPLQLAQELLTAPRAGSMPADNVLCSGRLQHGQASWTLHSAHRRTHR